MSFLHTLLGFFPSLLQAHGHTALHMAAGLHANPHQEEILRLLLSRGADPSIRNLENDQAAHLLQSGPQGEQVSRVFACSVHPVESAAEFVSRFQLKLLLKKRGASSRRRIAPAQDQ